MRVVMVNHSYKGTQIGGDIVQITKTKEALERQGIFVTIATGPQSVDFYKQFDLVHLFNIQTYSFSFCEAKKIKTANRPLALSTIYWDFHLLPHVRDEMFFWESKWRYSRYICGSFLLKKFYQLNNTKKLYLMKRIINLADILLPNSESEMCLLKKYFITDLNIQYEIIPNAVDIEIFNPYQVYPLPKVIEKYNIKSNSYILEVGRIEPCKNQLSLIKTCKTLNLPLLLVGSSSNKRYLIECKKAAGNHPVIFSGPISHEELAAYYFHAKIHALPSWRETPGLSNLEAAAMGCTIVTTSIGSGYEYFKDSAYYCNPFSQYSIDRAIEQAFNNKRSLKFDLIRNKYTWQCAANRTLMAYNRLLK